MLPMNQKDGGGRIKHIPKYKKRQKYNRMPQTWNRQKLACIMWSRKRGSWWYMDQKPHQNCMCTHKSQQSTKKNKQANLKRGKKYNKKCQKWCSIVSWLSSKEKVHESVSTGWMPHHNYMYCVVSRVSKWGLVKIWTVTNNGYLTTNGIHTKCTYGSWIARTFKKVHD